jgi:LCP family protein required for cell wall assembly
VKLRYRIISILLILLLIFTGCSYLNKTNKVANEDELADVIQENAKDASKKTVDSIVKGIKDKVKATLDPQEVFGKDAINFVFFGLDKNEERVKTLGSFRTDTIIVARVDFKNKSIKMLSIPRDTYVPIANRNTYNRINAAFPFGGGIKGDGFKNSKETISNFLGGVGLDRYFGMDMSVIPPVVDAIGGVEYYVDVTYTKKGYNLREGLQVLDGKTAEQYVRFRYSPMGDIDRIQRQQKFLTAFLKEAKKKTTVEKGLEIYQSVKGNVYTDLSVKEMMALGYFVQSLDGSDIEGHYVKGSFLNKNGASYWKPDMEYVQEIVEELEFMKDDVE